MNCLFDRPQSLSHPRYVSHRGFQPMAPANSLPAFAYAGMLRQWAIETDVHMTRDGVLVCCHNATVEETYDGQGAIAEMTWAELERLRIRSGNRLACFSDEQRRMPLFSEYLAICRRYGSIPFIELKTRDVGPVLEAVRRAGLGEEEIVLSSGDLDALLMARRESPSLFLHWIFAKESRVEELARAGNAGLSWRIDDPLARPVELIERAHKAGLRVCLRAADSMEAVKTMLALGLDYLPTNCMHISEGVFDA